MTTDSALRLNHEVIDGAGPPVLLVHGALASRSYWADNVEALSAICTPVVVELWGHGRSPSPSDPGRYEPAGYAAEFERLRTELGVDRWATVGQSMGAAITLHYGLLHPERVVAHVITNSSSAFSDPTGWRDRHADLLTPMLTEVRAKGMSVLRETWINPGRSRKIADATRARLVAEFEEHDVAGVTNSLDVTNYHLPLGSRLEQVTVPTLLTLGTREERFLNLVPQAKRIPNLEIVELHAGHPVNAHDPAGWNTAAIDFLGPRLAR